VKVAAFWGTPKRQDKRSAIPIEKGDIDLWLAGEPRESAQQGGGAREISRLYFDGSRAATSWMVTVVACSV
jgi:hypothetical protein